MNCQKRKRVGNLREVFSGIVLEIIGIDQFIKHHLFENWTMENPSDSSRINFFVLRNVHRLMGCA